MDLKGMASIKRGLRIYLDTNQEVDEWFFERIREALDKELSSDEAFELIADVASLTAEDEYREAWQDLFDTLLFLARKSETTEMPKGLADVWKTLQARAQQEGPYAASQFEELRYYYRQPP